MFISLLADIYFPPSFVTFPGKFTFTLKEENVSLHGILVTGCHKTGVKDRVIEAEIEVGLLGVVAGSGQEDPQLGGHLHFLLLVLGRLLLLRLERREV